MKHIFKKTSHKLATLKVTFDAGALKETTKYNAGVAHVLEHMLFKGTEKRTWKEIDEDIAKIGGRQNAYTSFEEVSYFITMPCDSIETATEVLSDMIYNSTIPDEEFLKEIEVIKEEEIAHRDDPSIPTYEAYSKALYGGTRQETPVIGTQESIAKITAQEVRDFYKEFCRPDNCIVSLVGNIKKDAAAAILNKYFKPDDGVFNTHYEDLDLKIPKENVLYLKDDKNEHTHVTVLFKGPKLKERKHKDIAILNAMMHVLAEGMDSRLFVEARQKENLCYHIGGGLIVDRDNSLLNFSFQCRAKNVKRIMEIIEQETAKIETDSVDDNDLNKYVISSKTSTYSIYDSSYGLAGAFTKIGMYNYKTLEKSLKDKKKITKEQVQKVAKKYFADEPLILIQGPEDIQL